MSETNKALIRRGFEQSINTGDFTIMNDILASDYVYHDPTVGTKHGFDEWKAMLTMYRTAFPDLRFTIEDQIAEGNKVLTRWTCTATHKGDYMGMKPTGNRVILEGMLISTIENGKVVDDFQTWDALGLLMQLGAVAATVKTAA